MSSKWLTGRERQLEEVKRCGQRRIPRTELSILCLQSMLSCRPSFRGAGPHEKLRHRMCRKGAYIPLRILVCLLKVSDALCSRQSMSYYNGMPTGHIAHDREGTYQQNFHSNIFNAMSARHCVVPKRKVDDPSGVKFQRTKSSSSVRTSRATWCSTNPQTIQ